MPESSSRDVALVLSGGGINGFLLEYGFLKRIRESPLWPRIGWIYGTSAGALSGAMAALDRLDDLEQFLLDLQPTDVFSPRRLWQLPGGLHDYTLPATIETRLAKASDLGEDLTRADVELVVFATDVSSYLDLDGTRNFELVYPARSTPPETLTRALLASAAISALVLPITVGDAVATDGSWVRNFPLSDAQRNPDVRAIAGFRYLASYRPTDVSVLSRTRERLERFRAVAPVRALLAELDLAEQRVERGEPAHYPELIVRLMRVAIARNTVLEEQLAHDRDAAVAEVRRIRQDVTDAAIAAAPPWRRSRLRAELDSIFDGARLPFPHDRHLPSLVVRGAPGDDALDPSFRGDEPWPEERKLALIARGYRLTDEAFAAAPPGLLDDRPAETP